MRKLWCALGAVAIVFVAGAQATADDQTELKALIDKAIKAHGGEAKLKENKAVTMKGKGKFYGQGEGIDFTGEFASQPPGKNAVRVQFEVNGMKVTFAMVIDGDKGWRKINDETTEMDKEALAEEKERMYAGSVSSLASLKDAEFQLSPLGEVEIGKQKATGVNVARKDHRDVKLFFDQKTGRLLKRETRIKDIEGSRKVTEEVFYQEYKIISGILRATKVEIKWDGKPHVEIEYRDFKSQDKLDDSVFAKP